MDMDAYEFIAGLGEIFWDGLNTFRIPILNVSFIGLMLGIVLIRLCFKVFSLLFTGVLSAHFDTSDFHQKPQKDYYQKNNNYSRSKSYSKGKSKSGGK